jgi:hypothetical protein
MTSRYPPHLRQKPGPLAAAAALARAAGRGRRRFDRVGSGEADAIDWLPRGSRRVCKWGDGSGCRHRTGTQYGRARARTGAARDGPSLPAVACRREGRGRMTSRFPGMLAGPARRPVGPAAGRASPGRLDIDGCRSQAVQPRRAWRPSLCGSSRASPRLQDSEADQGSLSTPRPVPVRAPAPAGERRPSVPGDPPPPASRQRRDSCGSARAPPAGGRASPAGPRRGCRDRGPLL